MLITALITTITTLLVASSAHAAPRPATDHFDTCSGVERSLNHPGEMSSLGENLGPGVSEVLTDELRALTNQGLASIDHPPLPSDSAALRYFNNGQIVALNSHGSVIAEISRPDTNPWKSIRQAESQKAAPQNAIINEVKCIVGACLGFGGAGGMSFEQLVRWLANPVTAAKFVIRRIGIAGAVSCIGGIIWTYLGR